MLRISDSEDDSARRPAAAPEAPSSEAAPSSSEAAAALPGPAGFITPKAVVAGAFMGVLCCFLELYYSLKTGVTPVLNVLSGVGGYMLIRAMLRLRVLRGNFTIGENAVAQTIAVACFSFGSSSIGFAGPLLGMSYEAYVDAGGDSFAGNRISDTVPLRYADCVLWCLALGFFGFFVALPLRNYALLNLQLPFPSGTITAHVLERVHSLEKGVAAANRRGFALLARFFSLAYCTNVFCWLFGGLDEFPIFGVEAASQYGWTVDWDLGSVGIGALLPFQTSASMMAGAVVMYGVVQPCVRHFANGPDKWVDLDNVPSPFLGLQAYAVFGGMAMMLTNACWMFARLVGTILLAARKQAASGSAERTQEWPLSGSAQRTQELVSAGSALRTQKRPAKRTISGSTLRTTALSAPQSASRTESRTESRTGSFERLARAFREDQGVPRCLPYLGYLFCGSICVSVLQARFNVAWYKTLTALLVLPLLALSNVHAMGTTDWDVGGTHGKVMLFPFGAWAGGSILTALSLCAVTISGCSSCAVLMQDFRTGLLLGCPPSRMLWAQLLGALLGSLVCPGLFVLLRTAFTLPNTQEAGAFLQGRFGTVYRVLAAVAAGAGGFSALPKNALALAAGFALFTLLLLALRAWAPKNFATQWLPDPAGLAIGCVVPCAVSLSFFVGALLARHGRSGQRQPPVQQHRSNPDLHRSNSEHHRSNQQEKEQQDAVAYIASGCVAGTGLGVVTRCILAVFGVSPPVRIEWSSAAQRLDGLRLTLLLLCCLAFSGVLACGLHFWDKPAPASLDNETRAADPEWAGSFSSDCSPATASRTSSSRSLRGGPGGCRCCGCATSAAVE